MVARPGGELSTRPLHFIWIADCSGSMAGAKIAKLNFAVNEALPAMRKVASENPNAQVLVRAIKFSSGAQWHVGTPTPVDTFEWTNLAAGGVTDMGRALSMVADELKIPPMTDRALPPVLVLLSDGQPTDDVSRGLQALQNEPWGRKAVRIAIFISSDTTVEDTSVLQRFINNPEITPLVAERPQDLVNYIRWASTVVLRAASTPSVGDSSISSAGPALPPPPPPSGAGDVW